MDDPLAPWRGAADALVPVRVTPRARTEGVETVDGPDGTPMLAVRVRAAPEDGKANAAVCALLAEAFGVPKSAVSVLRGGASRQKLVRVAR